jgi:hypothetical protein
MEGGWGGRSSRIREMDNMIRICVKDWKITNHE